MSDLMNLKEAIVNGKLEEAKAIVNEALEAGVDEQEIINNYLIKGMEEIGERFDQGKAFVPNLLLAARAMKGCLEILKPRLKDGSGASLGTLVIGTVKGDLHDIGKNLVRMMIEGKGIEIIDLGVDVEPQDFVKCAIENDCSIICCSALLTTTMPMLGEVIKAAEEAGIRDKVTIMVGGAPVNQAFADSIGADIYTEDAASAADAAAAVLHG